MLECGHSWQQTPSLPFQPANCTVSLGTKTGQLKVSFPRMLAVGSFNGSLLTTVDTDARFLGKPKKTADAEQVAAPEEALPVLNRRAGPPSADYTHTDQSQLLQRWGEPACLPPLFAGLLSKLNNSRLPASTNKNQRHSFTFGQRELQMAA